MDNKETKNEVEAEVEAEVEVEEVEVEETAEDEVEKVTVPAKKYGTIFNCDELRVRETPDANGKVLTTLHKGSMVEIESEDYGDFYKLYTETGVDGFCMMAFVKID